MLDRFLTSKFEIPNQIFVGFFYLLLNVSWSDYVVSQEKIV